jgi:hypothetical protein
VIAPAAWVVELRLICHSFRVAEIGPVPPPDAAGVEQATTKLAMARSPNHRRTVPVILSSSPPLGPMRESTCGCLRRR